MRARLISLLAAAPLLTACIYNHTVGPLTTNFHHTPVFTGKLETGAGDIKHLTVPLARVPLSFEWDSNALGDIAKREGLEELYYADIERLIVLGVWYQEFVHLYGKPAPGVH